MNHNFRLLHTLYASTFGKYIKFKQRYDKAVLSGKFKKLSKAKQSLLISRLRKLYDRLKSLQAQLRLAGVGVAFSLSMAFINPVSAQSTLGPFVRADKKNPLPPPFLTNHPRVAAVDIDGDGDVDTFVGNADGDILFLKNDSPTTGGKILKFNEVTGTGNPFNGVNKGNWSAPAFADVDGDGDFDMLLGTYEGSTFFFRNTGTRTNPVFTEQTGSNNPFNGFKGTENQESIPSFVDIDGDGDIDLFIGSSKYNFQSGVNFYENQGSKNAPNFVSTEHAIENLAIFNSSYYSYRSISLAFTDIDGDDDQDLIVGQRNDRVRVFENTDNGSSFNQIEGPWDELLSNTFGNGSPAFGDFDKDGDVDLILGVQQWVSPSLLYYENTDGEFTLKVNNEINANSPVGGVFAGKMARVAFADLDADLDLDAVIGGKYYNQKLLVYKNNAGVFSRDFEHPLTDIDLNYQSLPKFVDIDGDNDHDLFVGSMYNALFFKNQNGIFTQDISPLPHSHSQAFLDIDGDGDLDAFITTWETPKIKFYRNTGTRTNPVFTLDDTPSPFDDINPKYLAYVTSVDFDRDGDLDIVVSKTDLLNGEDEAKTTFQFIENRGNTTFAEVESPFNETVSKYSYITFADLDGDGDEDIFVGFGDDLDEARDGTFRYYENLGINESGNSIVVFNAVSPNNPDGKNDYLHIQDIETTFPKNKVRIFNRWGNEVYHVSDYDNDTKRFEGRKNNGDRLPTGIYFYTIEVPNKKVSGYLSLKW